MPPGRIAKTAEEARAAAEQLGGPRWVIKAQVHAGGRGRAGGVRLADSLDAVTDAADGLLGQRLVTAQTGTEGKQVKQVYVEQACDITRELYLALLVDRSAGRVALIASADGGEDVEEAAAEAPETLFKLVPDPGSGLDAAAAAELAGDLGLDGDQAKAAADLMAGLYKAFHDTDASLIEINPLAVTDDGDIVAVDVKMIVDDNALYRHPELEKLRDEDEVDPSETEAQRFELNYVKMDGNIGVMVTGAGLALATLDMIKAQGGEPADFMDVRPVADRDKVASGIAMLLRNPRVKSVLVNAMGGGIQFCDVITEGVAIAWKQAERTPPLIVRLAGTAKELGELALNNQGIPAVFAQDLEDAVDKAVRAARGEDI